MREFLKIDRKPKKTNKSEKFIVKVNFCWLCDKSFKQRVDKF